MSIEKDIQKILDESKKTKVISEEEIVEEIEVVEEEALKPDNGTEEPNVKRNNDDQTVSQKGVTTGVDNEKPSDNDQSKEKPAASGSKSKNVSFGDNEKPDGGHDQSKDRMESITVDVSDDIEALVNGEELSEEFKTKATTIFEAAVVTKVKEELVKIEESYQARLEEEVNVIQEGLVEKVDGYLDYMVEQWLKDNEIALTHGIKVEMMENFMSGMKTLFSENFVDIPEEKFDVLESLESRLAEAEAKLNESEANNVELHSAVNEMKREKLIAESCDGLSDTQKEKFTSLVEELSFEDEETFVTKLKTIRENYITKNKSVNESNIETFVTDEPILEEVQTKKLSESMSRYSNVLNKSNK